MNRIRDLREDRDLRQIDVANAVGIDQQTISNYETERTRPDSTKHSDRWTLLVDIVTYEKKGE